MESIGNTLTATGRENLSKAGEASRGSSISRVTIPANGTNGIDAFGVSFYVIQSTSDIGIKSDKTVFKTYKQGTGERFTKNFEFQRLEFSNPNAYDVTVFIWYGFGEYIDRRFELLDASTSAVAYSGTVTNPVPVIFNGVPSGTQTRRKYAIVTNLDAANPIKIRDLNGNNMATVFKEQNFIVDSSAGFEIFNETGAGIAYEVAEFWYINSQV